MKTLIFCNRRGGCGKTITAYNVAYDLATLHRQKVLLIDGDPQCTLTMCAGMDGKVRNLCTAIRGDNLPGNIQQSKAFDFVAGSGDLEAITIHPTTIKDLISQIRGRYDIVIIDSQPANNEITAAIMYAADLVFITSTAEKFSILGAVKAVSQMEALKKIGATFKPGGIILTCVEARGTLYKDMADQLYSIAKQLGTKVITPPIHKAIAAAESTNVGQPLEIYAPNSKPAMDYKELTENIYKIIQRSN